jgi:isopentenyl phosphate kinase
MSFIFGMRNEVRKSVKTHVTTNVRKESIPILYGDYIFDRLNEMFNFIEIKGESRR